MFLTLAALLVAASMPQLQFAGCQPAQVSEMTRLITVELTGRDPGFGGSIAIACSPSTIEISVRDANLERHRELDPATSERTIALAAVELIDAIDDASRQAGAAEPDRSAPQSPQAKSPSTWLLSVSAIGGMTHAPTNASIGGTIGADVYPFSALSQLGLHIDVLADHTRRSLSAGDASLVRSALGLAATARTTGPQWRATVSAGLRGGPLFIQGTAPADNASAHTGTRFWLGPMLRAGLELSLTEHLVLLAGAESGLVTHSVSLNVTGQHQASLNGVWLLGTLGLGLAL
jgi:hypothetical protein